jgi:hypothetical protein
MSFPTLCLVKSSQYQISPPQKFLNLFPVLKQHLGATDLELTLIMMWI